MCYGRRNAFLRLWKMKMQMGSRKNAWQNCLIFRRAVEKLHRTIQVVTRLKSLGSAIQPESLMSIES